MGRRRSEIKLSAAELGDKKTKMSGTFIKGAIGQIDKKMLSWNIENMERKYLSSNSYKVNKCQRGSSNASVDRTSRPKDL